LIFSHYAASTIFNFKSNNVGSGDIIEIFRPVIYLFALLFSLIILSPYIKKEGMWNCMDYIENLVFYSSFLEFFKFIEGTKSFFYLYSPFSYNSLNYIRFFGVTGFAYAYAWILIICILYHSIKTNGKIGFRFLYYSFIVLLTGSRTGIAALLLLYFCLFIMLKKIRFRLFLLFVLLVSVVSFLYVLKIPVVVTSVDYSIRLIQAFFGNAGDGSLGTRQSQINIALSRFYENPFYGTASNKVENVLIENFYFHHLGAWGFIGLLLYFLWICSFRIYLISKKEKRIFFLIIIISLVISFSSPIFDQVRLFNIFYAVIAVLIAGVNKGAEKSRDGSL
jgi:hypothetical protein